MRIVISTLIAICVFMISSCNSEKPTREDANSGQKADSVAKQDTASIDSLRKTFEAKIESLQNQSQNLRYDVDKAQKTIDDLANSIKIWQIIAVAAVLLSIVSVIVSLLKGGKGRKDSPHSSSPAMPAHPYPVSKVSEKRLKEIESRMSELKWEIATLTNTLSPSIPVTPSPVVPKKETSKVGYAKANEEELIYADKVLGSKQEGCVYKFEFKSDSRCEFDLISLDKIKSGSKWWQKAVEIIGGCSLEDATSHDVVAKGECVRTSDGKAWRVVKKLKIKLKK